MNVDDASKSNSQNSLPFAAAVVAHRFRSLTDLVARSARLGSFVCSLRCRLYSVISCCCCCCCRHRRRRRLHRCSGGSVRLTVLDGACAPTETQRRRCTPAATAVAVAAATAAASAATAFTPRRPRQHPTALLVWFGYALFDSAKSESVLVPGETILFGSPL